MKYDLRHYYASVMRRPPRRGAWIEIDLEALNFERIPVAPRAGGRGLKCHGASREVFGVAVAPRAGGRGLKCLPERGY